MKRLAIVSLLLLRGSLVMAADTPSKPLPKVESALPVLVRSPEVEGDRVTFRIAAPHAREVTVFGDFGWQPKALEKAANGVWSLSLPLPPGIWGYTFSVDGQRLPDPVNAWIKPSRLVNTSAVLVPATPPLPHEAQGAPRGTVHLHTYDSKAASGPRRLRVYTPPGYATGRGKFPVLYLLHGFSDNEAAWTEFGRAHVIADNLLAGKQAVPAIIVMTDGHAIPMDREKWQENLEAYQQDLLNDVMPFIESRYRTKNTAADRAIVGLSMGGEQALSLGLNHPQLFSWVGGMSAATRHREVFEPGLSNPEVLNKKLRWLWLSIGKDDFLLEHNRTFVEILKEKGVRHAYRETEGAHAWPVWRGYLADVLPQLFRPTPAASRRAQ